MSIHKLRQVPAKKGINTIPKSFFVKNCLILADIDAETSQNKETKILF